MCLLFVRNFWLLPCASFCPESQVVCSQRSELPRRAAHPASLRSAAGVCPVPRLGRAPLPAPPVRVAVCFPSLGSGRAGSVLGVPSPWALMGALAGRWVARSRGGRFQNPRAPGWCQLTGGRVGPGGSGPRPPLAGKPGLRWWCPLQAGGAGPGVGDHWGGGHGSL